MLLSGRLSGIFSAGLQGCGEGGGVRGRRSSGGASVSGVRAIFFGDVGGASASSVGVVGVLGIFLIFLSMAALRSGRSGVSLEVHGVHGILLRGGMGKLLLH